MTRAATDISDRKVSFPPGPPLPTIPLAGLLYLTWGEPVVERLFERYGGMFSVWAPGIGRVVFITDPAMVKDLFVADPATIDSTEGQRPLELVYGPRSLFLLDGPPHRSLRKLLVPPLRGEPLARHRETMVAVAERALERWPLGEPFALLPELHAVGLEIILRVVMGIDDEVRLRRWSPPMQRLVELGMSEQMTLRYLTRQVGGIRLWPAFHQTLAECDELVYDEIARRRSEDGLDQATDIMALLLGASDEHGEALTDAAVRDQLMTLLLAGHETTATTLAWVFERLLRHPAALEQVTAEARAGEDSYAEATLHETLRLCPPLAVVARVVREPFELGGHVLPPGTQIVPYIRLVHRRRELYPDPTAFRPERFLDSRPPAYGWIPFGGGVHACLGGHFALMEMKAVLQTVLRRGVLSPADPNDEPVKRKAIGFLPGHGCRVVLDSRRPAAAAEPAATRSVR